ncbi:hypothetical protein OY14_04665 (plasmid) [Borreliella chilensis]|uniref:Uncharacterized protein n=1 Tax=Borreliella chilensis TaxID=1245910 RepID=A0A0A7UXB4_9SPIR|nr:hypothetical protein OY14_04665 [Borreliella chilensis]
MKKNKLTAIFLLLILTVLIMLSCSFEGNKDNDKKTKKFENENDLPGTEEVSQNTQNEEPKIDDLLVAIDALNNPPQIAAGNIANNPNLAALQQPNKGNANANANANAKSKAPKQTLDPEAQELIQKIIDRSANIIKISEFDSNRDEPDDQFGMKKDIFSKIIFNAGSTIHFDEEEYLTERRMLYTSLNYNEGTIVNLGKILSKLSQDSNYLSLVKETLINRGFSIQLSIEEISAKIMYVRHRLQNLSKPNLKTLYYDFNKLTTLKEEWLKDVDNIIKEYNNNPELRNNISKLNDNIQLKNPKAKFAAIQTLILNLVNTTTNILAPIQ